MTFECICKRCFAEYEVDRSDIMRGSRWWTICPSCRLSDAAELPQNRTVSDTAPQMAEVTKGCTPDEFETGDAA